MDEALLTQNGVDPILIEGKYPGETPEEIVDYRLLADGRIKQKHLMDFRVQ